MRFRSSAITSSILSFCALITVGCAHRTVEVGTALQAGDLRVSDKLIFHVQEPKHDYYALVAKDGTKGGTFARARVRASTFYVQLFNGYMYLWGTYPIGATQNVQAAAQGSTMIIELLPDRERVYLLTVNADEKVVVSLDPNRKPIPGGATSRSLNEHQYVECIYMPDGKLDLQPAQPIPLTPGLIRTFLDQVHADVVAANLGGWPSPWPWP